jgi:hypothetical protein
MVLEAIAESDPNVMDQKADEIISLLKEIDLKLTKAKPLRFDTRSAGDKEELLEFINDVKKTGWGSWIYYLSDGGFSRLGFRKEGSNPLTIKVTNESTVFAMKRWTNMGGDSIMPMAELDALVQAKLQDPFYRGKTV